MDETLVGHKRDWGRESPKERVRRRESARNIRHAPTHSRPGGFKEREAQVDSADQATDRRYSGAEPKGIQGGNRKETMDTPVWRWLGGGGSA